MPRDEEVPYEQDRFGNERRKLDQLRAQEGMYGTSDDNEGIVSIADDDVDTELVVYEIPEHADETILDLIHAYNSSDDGTFTLYEATLDSDGDITDTTQRSVPLNVAADATRTVGYEGVSFTEDAIAVNSEFEGEIGVAVLSDHKEYSEADSENY